MPIIQLDAGCTVTLEALDPTTDAAVSGVTLSNVTIYARAANPGKGPPLVAVEPTWINLPQVG
jgi:hypothetical protein